MKPYDAKQSQTCKICGFKLSHNKQGRFTSHIKNEHGISLETYLLSHYYEPEDLKCSYKLCDNKVELYRGTPTKYCSKACGGRGRSEPIVCVICNLKFDTNTRPHRKTKTCSDDCEKKLRSKKTKAWHDSMEKNKKEEHFKRIISKTAKTRRKNKTPSWNSGKTGIYSEETIEKIRRATLKQMEEQCFKKTRIEKVIEEYLKVENIEYRYSFILQKRQYDFFLPKHKLIIECDGDYWHANPNIYPEPADWQIERIRRDLEKMRLQKEADIALHDFGKMTFSTILSMSSAS